MASGILSLSFDQEKLTAFTVFLHEGAKISHCKLAFLLPHPGRQQTVRYGQGMSEDSAIMTGLPQEHSS